MKKSDQIKIKQEFDKSIRYLDLRDSKYNDLTTKECLQEIGHLRLFIFNMGFEKSGDNQSITI